MTQAVSRVLHGLCVSDYDAYEVLTTFPSRWWIYLVRQGVRVRLYVRHLRVHGAVHVQHRGERP